MADYFTRFSLVLKLHPAQQQYAVDLAIKAGRHRYEEESLPPDFPPSLVQVVEDWSFETEKDSEGIWLHSDYGGIDAAIAFLQHLLQKFDPEGCARFEWSHDCSKPRTDAYGGGAAVVTAKKVETMSTSQWLASVTI